MVGRNSAGLGIYVLMSALFAEVLIQPPFSWGFNTLGWVFAGQIATAIVVPFLCGSFSDLTTKWLSMRNNGISEVIIFDLDILVTMLTGSSRNIVY
jgi:hypothetical protein